jgi:hypothetical protein
LRLRSLCIQNHRGPRIRQTGRRALQRASCVDTKGSHMQKRVCAFLLLFLLATGVNIFAQAKEIKAVSGAWPSMQQVQMALFNSYTKANEVYPDNA